MALTMKRGSGRFRCQRMDPAGVWSRLEPRGKALRWTETQFKHSSSALLTFTVSLTLQDEIISSHTIKEQDDIFIISVNSEKAELRNKVPTAA